MAAMRASANRVDASISLQSRKARSPSRPERCSAPGAPRRAGRNAAGGAPRANDAGHRVYATVLLALLVPGTPEPRGPRKARATDPSATAASTDTLDNANHGNPKGR